MINLYLKYKQMVTKLLKVNFSEAGINDYIVIADGVNIRRRIIH